MSDEPADDVDATDDGTSDADAAEQELDDKLEQGLARRKRALLDLARRGAAKDRRTYAVANLLDERVIAVLEADGVGTDGGDPGVVGDLLVRLKQLFDSVGASLTLRELAFGNSVHLELDPDVPRDVRERVDQLAAEDPDRELDEADLKELIPDSVAAAATVARLLSVPSQRGLRSARALGADVPDAYLRLARVVQDNSGTLHVSAPGDWEASLSRERAERVVRSVKDVEELEPERMTIAGKLTRTDSEDETFRVVLDTEQRPPQFDARRRVVEGEYTRTAHDQVQKHNLWDRHVIAEVRAYRTRDPRRASATYDHFVFTNVRARQ